MQRMSRLDLKGKLWNPRAVTLCLFGVIILSFLLSDDPEDAKFRLSTDSWREQSSNKFSYNICSLSTSQRRREGRGSSLPLAHRTWIPPGEKQRRGGEDCDAAEDGWRSWRNRTAQDNKALQVCSKLFVGDNLNEDDEIFIKESNRNLSQTLSISDLVDNTNNCSWVSEEFSSNHYITQRERDFPIAYAININHSPHQVLRFLKAIYRPHNVYCLHFDRKTSHAFKQVFFNLASCLGNVVVPRKIEDVYRGWYTLVEAHLSCFSDLVLARDEYPWRYVITLCGMEVPLRTNAEIVAMLEPLNGTSSVQTVGGDGVDDFKYKWKWSLNKETGWIMKRDVPLPPVPYGLKVYKSWAYVALSHQFVEYLLCSPVALALREFMKDVRIPEENIYAMLFMHPNTPGGYRSEHRDRLFQIISCIWLDGDHHGLWRRIQMMLYPRVFCSGSNTHNICMIGARDLSKLAFRPGVEGYLDVDTFLQTDGEVQLYSGRDRGPLFHNRYVMEHEGMVMDCMERELGRRNRLEQQKECLS